MTIEAKQLFFLDSAGSVTEETMTSGFLAQINRWLSQITGAKNYNLCGVISKLYQDLQAPKCDSATINKDVTFLCKKLAKKCKIDSTLFDQIIQAQSKFHIEDLVKPLNKSEVRSKIESFVKLLPKDAPLAKNIQTILDRTKAKARWDELGLPSELFNKDPEGACFLIQQRLAYSIVGFQESTSTGVDRHQIKLNGELKIKFEGQYVPISFLRDNLKLTYSVDHQQLVDAQKRKWLYLSPDGLQKIDRLDAKNTPKLQSVEELPEKDLKALQNHACEFVFTDGKQVTPHSHPCVLQIFTNPLKIRSEVNLLQRFQANMHGHAGIVLTKADGKVYSTGFGETPEEGAYSDKWYTIMSSINGLPTLFDYETFRTHDGRVVTSIPVTQDTFDDIMNDLNEMREKSIRYNPIKQNCYRLASTVMEKAGVKVHHQIDHMVTIAGIFPVLSDVAFVGFFTKRIRQISTFISEKTGLPHVTKVALSVWNVFRSVNLRVNIVTNFMMNVLVLALGGGKGSPVRETSYDSGKEEGFQPFHSLFDSIWSVFSHKPSMIYHAHPLIRWQLEQPSTFVHPYHKPSMSIIPLTKKEEQEEAFNLHEKLFKRFHKGIFGTQEDMQNPKLVQLAERIQTPKEMLDNLFKAFTFSNGYKTSTV